MRTIATSSRARMGRSKLAGVPTVVTPMLPTGEPTTGQLTFPAPAPARATHVLLPDVVHITGFLDADQQRNLVTQFRDWALPPAGLRHPRVPRGHLMSVQSVCLGWHWQPYAYSHTADDTDGAPVKPLPRDLAELAQRAVDESYGRDHPDALEFVPDAAIVNLYAPGAHLGLHQDGEEPSAAPVVTLSLGDTCVFRMAGVDRRTQPFTDVLLQSGDLLVFGGVNRRIYHGVPRVLDGTAPAGLGLPPGRLSITLRQTGFDPAGSTGA